MCQYANDINLQHLGLQHAASPRGVFLACTEYYLRHVSMMKCTEYMFLVEIAYMQEYKLL